MHKVVYFRRVNGRKPTAIWLDTLEKNVTAGILAKLGMLEAGGLSLLDTNILKHIVGQQDLYEIKYGQFRLLVYYDKKIDSFITLNGFKKQKMNEHEEIEFGIKLRKEYLTLYGGNL